MRVPVSLRMFCSAAIHAITLAACTGTPVERQDRSSQVDLRQLPPTSATVRYEVDPLEHFRMPQPLRAATPRFPAAIVTDFLPPTTVCVRVIVNAQGIVERVDALQDRVECRAAPTPVNISLLQAVREQLLQWTFVPAAICRLPPDAGFAASTQPCSGAALIQAVPVSLMYAFTFEVRDGRATVQTSDQVDR